MSHLRSRHQKFDRIRHIMRDPTPTFLHRSWDNLVCNLWYNLLCQSLHRRIVTVIFYAVYKYSYLLTYIASPRAARYPDVYRSFKVNVMAPPVGRKKQLNGRSQLQTVTHAKPSKHEWLKKYAFDLYFSVNRLYPSSIKQAGSPEHYFVKHSCFAFTALRLVVLQIELTHRFLAVGLCIFILFSFTTANLHLWSSDDLLFPHIILGLVFSDYFVIIGNTPKTETETHN